MNLQLLPELLLPWFEQNKRNLPWRTDRVPYHVWLSEIMLQQTRVEAVRNYYFRFLEVLPTIRDLAACDDDKLRKLWEGLGYYSRVKNLKKAAQMVCEEYRGTFPTDFISVSRLPGIGPYTAGAICSICFEQPTPAVDGNVLRVVARFTAMRDSISKPETKKEVETQLRTVYPEGACGSFTQALMELGAIVCIPNGVPHCELCPLKDHCASHECDLWRIIPVKDKKKPRRSEEKTVFLLRCGDKAAIRRRPEHGLLAGLWELPNAEGTMSAQEALDYITALDVEPAALRRRIVKRHIFTHIEWNMTCYEITCRSSSGGFVWASDSELRDCYSLPTAFRQFLEDELK